VSDPRFDHGCRDEFVVRFTDAAVRVGGRTVWSGVHVVIRRGEFVAVLGPNGAGKSTMIKAILGLVPLSAGKLDVLGAGPGVRNRAVGYVPQRRSFDAEVRIRGVDLVRLGLTGPRWGVPVPFAQRVSAKARREAERVEEVIELVGAADYADRPIGELSGGEQQRLLIAQALAARPRLLLLDEPLESLDLPNQAAVAALVATICRAEDVAVVLVAHDVNPILGYVEEVIYLAGGHAAAGKPREVITDSTLSQLYGTSVEVLSTPTGRLVVVGATDEPSSFDHRHHP
jgi:zinc/manganese transport system ATP-binding protein